MILLLGYGRRAFAGGLLLACAFAAQAASIEVTVLDALEGDVVAVGDASGNRYVVRLAGIDAPEADQPFGVQARERLEALASGQSGRLDWDKVDRHGRVVGTLWVASPDMPCRGETTCAHNLDVGHALITLGLAWHCVHHEVELGDEQRAGYAFDENEARIHRAGLWAEPDPLPPWDWRERRLAP